MMDGVRACVRALGAGVLVVASYMCTYVLYEDIVNSCLIASSY